MASSQAKLGDLRRRWPSSVQFCGTFRSTGWTSGCRLWQIPRHLPENSNWRSVRHGALCWHTETDGLFSEVQIVLQLLILFPDYLLQHATAMLFFWQMWQKFCSPRAKRSHHTSQLIFTIYLIFDFFFLTKQFPRKPEHTKCIKKTVQLVSSCLDVV